MGSREQIDRILTSVPTYDRRRCIDQLHQIKRPRIDFTEEYLNKLSLDRLRHVVVAAYLQARKYAR